MVSMCFPRLPPHCWGLFITRRVGERCHRGHLSFIPHVEVELFPLCTITSPYHPHPRSRSSKVARTRMVKPLVSFFSAFMHFNRLIFVTNPKIDRETSSFIKIGQKLRKVKSWNHPEMVEVAFSCIQNHLLNPRPAGGGAFERPPSGFSRIAKKRRRAAPPGVHPPYPHLFRNFCENFGPRPCEVRSPGQVK